MPASLPAILTIGGTSYSAAQRAAARIKLDPLTLNLNGAYDLLTFHEDHVFPTPTFNEWSPVSLAVDIGDGNGSVLRFSGAIGDTQSGPSRLGWTHGYTVYGLRFLCDKLVPFTAYDGTGSYVWNRPPSDNFYYVQTDSGLSLGTIFTRVLTVTTTATTLYGLGVGGYTSLLPPTLPAATVADLALLTVVPAQPLMFQGNNLLGQMEQHLARWCPQFVLNLLPTGVLRFKDTTSTTTFAPKTITLPSGFATGGDPIHQLPRVRRSSQGCATRLVMRGGPEVEAAMLSLVDGTLAEAFTTTDKSNWNLTYFTAPNGASDYGTITAVTSTSATIQSHSSTFTFATNFWSSRESSIFLINPLATGITETEYRIPTSNTAMTAGSTAVVTWDASWPISAPTYTQYRIVARAGSLIDCWRLYEAREPATGNTGINTWIGAHLVKYSTLPVAWANSARSFNGHTAQANVVDGRGDSIPWPFETVPSLGGFRFTQPTVCAFGQTSILNTRSPLTVSEGIPSDVQILALYSRGALSVTVPPDVGGVPQYSGTAAPYMHVTEYIDVTSWIATTDTSSMTALAQQHLNVKQNLEYEFPVSWDIDSTGRVPAWNFLDFSFSVNLAIAGGTSPWSAINAVPRAITLDWNSTGAEFPGVQRVTFHCSTKRRPFVGDDLYLHPMFAGATGVGGLKGGLDMTGLGATLPSYDGPVATANAVSKQALGATADASHASFGALGAIASASMGAMNTTSTGAMMATMNPAAAYAAFEGGHYEAPMPAGNALATDKERRAQHHVGKERHATGHPTSSHPHGCKRPKDYFDPNKGHRESPAEANERMNRTRGSSDKGMYAARQSAEDAERQARLDFVGPPSSASNHPAYVGSDVDGFHIDAAPARPATTSGNFPKAPPKKANDHTASNFPTKGSDTDEKV